MALYQRAESDVRLHQIPPEVQSHFGVFFLLSSRWVLFVRIDISRFCKMLGALRRAVEGFTSIGHRGQPKLVLFLVLCQSFDMKRRASTVSAPTEGERFPMWQLCREDPPARFGHQDHVHCKPRKRPNTHSSVQFLLSPFIHARMFLLSLLVRFCEEEFCVYISHFSHLKIPRERIFSLRVESDPHCQCKRTPMVLREKTYT